MKSFGLKKSSTATASETTVTDADRLDQVLKGFEHLNGQFDEIRRTNDFLRNECTQLREENRKLRMALETMSSSRVKDYEQSDTLLKEIEELKATVIQERDLLEQYKQNLEEKNAQLKDVVEALHAERSKRCNCFTCRILRLLSNRQ